MPSTAHSSVRWCSHCGYCGYCPRPSSSALCPPCVADCCCCCRGCGGQVKKNACRAPGGARDSGDGCERALWCHRETPCRPRQRIPLLSWCRPWPQSCCWGYGWLRRSPAPPAGRLWRGGDVRPRCRWSQWLGTRTCPRQTAWLGRGGVCGRCCFLQPSQPDEGRRTKKQTNK